MNERISLPEENQQFAQRYDAAMSKVQSIPYDNGIDGPLGSFFNTAAALLSDIHRTLTIVSSGCIRTYNMEQLKELNATLYGGIAPEAYGTSFANPDYAVKIAGGSCGPLLSYLYVKMRDLIPCAFMQKKKDITLYCELFIEIYNLFAARGAKACRDAREAVAAFERDGAESFMRDRISGMLCPDESFASGIVMESDLSDLRYLYMYGEYVGPNELGTAAYLNTLPRDETERIASVFTEGYRTGFINARKDLSIKETVDIRYPVGFERIVRAAVLQFQKIGLKPVIYRGGYQASAANRQYVFDHKFDEAIYLDEEYVSLRLEVARKIFEQYKDQAAKMAGPAVIESFGEDPFEPEIKNSALRLSEDQEKLKVFYEREYMKITRKYIRGEERSFTIIAFPVPEVGADFPAVFEETVKINSLDPKVYGAIQQKLIAVLDRAESVRITGRNGNRTDLTVCLRPIEHPDDETNFENCLADINIPLGEVFTSPRLSGTNGILHVSSVYLNGLNFKDLELRFEDGRVSGYTCRNFDDEDRNRQYIKSNILHNHDTLPMGEFAIGTNTAAYMMANRYNLLRKLPILIGEKTGPHFAVGDTCYSWEEDVESFNPDGKKIAAKDNEITILRKTDPSKAYFNCHTDITIPYSELGEITAVTKEGWELSIIRDGRFVLRGTEKLNEAFDA